MSHVKVQRRHEGIDYIGFMAYFDALLHPNAYFEIGTNMGDSLRAFRCDAVAVDPTIQFEGHADHNVIGGRKRAFFFQMTSDDFFREHTIRHFLPKGPDIAFLDGLHLFEYLLRDFINTEAECHERSMILLHDCLPMNTRMAERTFRVDAAEDPATQTFWTGDVWRMLPILKKYRPDLRIVALNCPPTGLVAVMQLDPGSRVLRQHYHAITAEFSALTLEEYGIDRLWNEYPIADSRALLSPPHDFTATFTIC